MSHVKENLNMNNIQRGLNLAFGTVPLSLDQWLICLGMASLVLV